MYLNDKEITNYNLNVLSDLDIDNAKELFLSQSLSAREKSFMLKLISKVKQAIKLSRNLEVLEKISAEVYKTIEITDDIEKIEFEISRINKTISGNINNKDYYKKELKILRLLVDTYKNNKNVVDINDLYDSIIELEIELGLNIGLYGKLVKYFINKYKIYENTNLIDFSYDKKFISLAEEESKIKNKRKG